MHVKRVFWDVGTDFLKLMSFVIQRFRIIQLALNPLAVATWNSYRNIPISFLGELAYSRKQCPSVCVFLCLSFRLSECISPALTE